MQGVTLRTTFIFDGGLKQPSPNGIAAMQYVCVFGDIEQDL